MASNKKKDIYKLLKGIEAGDPISVAVVNEEKYIQHNPRFGDDLVELSDALSKPKKGGSIAIKYEKCHRILAEGNFDLSVCEGYANQTPFSFFDLYRLKNGEIVEHWDTTEVIPPQSKWRNNNGKF